MQKIDAGLFVVEIDRRSVRVTCKENNVSIVIESIGAGLMAKGEGKQAYESVGRDHSLLVESRLTKGMAPILELKSSG